MTAISGCGSSSSSTDPIDLSGAGVARQVEQEVEVEHVTCKRIGNGELTKFACDASAGERIHLGVRVPASGEHPVITSCEPADAKKRPNEFVVCAVHRRDD